MDEVNVEKIMEEIREELPAQEERWAKIRFEEIPWDGEAGLPAQSGQGGPFSMERLEEETDRSIQCCGIAFFRPLPGGVKGLFKRAVRKLIRFCVEPIAQEVSRFHIAAASALDSIRHFVREQRKNDRRRDEELAGLRQRVAELEERLAVLEETKEA